jgi:hypothetical protein
MLTFTSPSSAHRIDVRFDRAIVCDRVRRCFDLRIGRKRDPEGIVGIAIFLPVLCGGRTSENEKPRIKDGQSHIAFPFGPAAPARNPAQQS